MDLTLVSIVLLVFSQIVEMSVRFILGFLAGAYVGTEYHAELKPVLLFAKEKAKLSLEPLIKEYNEFVSGLDPSVKSHK